MLLQLFGDGGREKNLAQPRTRHRFFVKLWLRIALGKERVRNASLPVGLQARAVRVQMWLSQVENWSHKGNHFCLKP